MDKITRDIRVLKNNKSLRTKEKGKIGLMCPKCLKMHYADINNCITISNKNIDTNVEYYMQCEECSSHTKMIVIDYNIAEAIEILNKKGYFTVYCCEGHVEYDIEDNLYYYAPGYIYFLISYDKSILDRNPLPTEWLIYEEEAECGIFVIRENLSLIEPDFQNTGFKLTDKQHIELYADSKTKYINLLEWVKQLPPMYNDDLYPAMQMVYTSQSTIDRILDINAEKISRLNQRE